jgi:hypothetical protein
MLEQICSNAVPIIVLGIEPAIKLYHPFLLYARSRIRNVIKDCICDDTEKLLPMVEFVRDAIADIIGNIPAQENELYNSTVGQMMNEVARFYFVLDDYEQSLYQFLSLRDHLKQRNLKENEFL